ncbi:SDR family NAD(P)-dependent oxidoreductase [Sphingomonas sp. 3P27F8]|uniref:SDR family oxidoreductase n=1 Tax=Sphingomonas sp. 3P27F8 TaxID=2502213 RepID=UPI0010F7E601|nr:SDR family NAD(P)-dependent oxidoreductase [Sphingomonas sp. 3P27F8]
MSDLAEPPARDVSDAHTDMPSLSGRKAIISGGTTGIGRAIAVLLASDGVDVFVCGRDQQHLEDGLERIREVGKGGGMAVDLADPDGVDRFVAGAREYLGEFDIAIINAAIPAKGLTTMSADELRYAIATDFTAYLTTAYAAVEVMQDHGDIIFIGSVASHLLGAEGSVYAGMKAGVAGFAEAVRKELAPKGIKVCNIEPAKTGADFQYPDFTAAEQAEENRKETMLRAEDIAVGVHYVLTQPRRAVVQQVVIAPRARGDE